MGLDAVVYLRPKAVSANQSVTDEHATLSSDVPAIHKRLGNISMIGWLADETVQLVGRDSILLKKVLYSGSHSGDSIGLEDLNRLESEIKVISESLTTRSSDLERFLKDMSDLISKAREEAMPIVFV